MGDVAAKAVTDDNRSPADTWTVHQGDARHVVKLLSDVSSVAGSAGEPFLQTTITSPPYATLVDYGSNNQIGFGQSHADYLASCRQVFADVFNWTLSSGSMWIVADSLMSPSSAKLPSKFVPLPFDLAREAEAAGWTLRDVIIWRKDRTRPWSHPGKLRNGFEYVLFFVKSKDFKFNVDALRETSSLKSWWVKYPERHNPWGMTPDNVWEIPIPVQGSWASSAFRHACPFPPELVRRMVALSTDEQDVVFDPFAGSGVVIATATSDGRRAFGAELNPDYVEAFRESFSPDTRPEPSEPNAVGAMTERMLELRMLKYPKDLANQILRAGFTSAKIRAILMSVEDVNWKPARTEFASIECAVLVDDHLSEMETARLAKVISEVSLKAPLSKYGLLVRSRIVRQTEALANLSNSDPHASMAVYTKGRTWYAAASVEVSNLAGWLEKGGVQTVVPVISALHVEQTLEES